MNLYFDNNLYYQAMSTEEKSSVEKRDIPKFWNTPNISQVAFHNRLQELHEIDKFQTARWIGRIVMAIPMAAYTLVISNIYHLAALIILVLDKRDWSKVNFVRHFYHIGMNFSLAKGYLRTFFCDDERGLLAIHRARLEKLLYDSKCDLNNLRINGMRHDPDFSDIENDECEKYLEVLKGNWTMTVRVCSHDEAVDYFAKHPKLLKYVFQNWNLITIDTLRIWSMAYIQSFIKEIVQKNPATFKPCIEALKSRFEFELHSPYWDIINYLDKNPSLTLEEKKDINTAFGLALEGTLNLVCLPTLLDAFWKEKNVEIDFQEFVENVLNNETTHKYSKKSAQELLETCREKKHIKEFVDQVFYQKIKDFRKFVEEFFESNPKLALDLCTDEKTKQQIIPFWISFRRKLSTMMLAGGRKNLTKMIISDLILQSSSWAKMIGIKRIKNALWAEVN